MMRLFPLVPVAALVFAVSACGASGGDDSASTTTASAEVTTTIEGETTETTAPAPDGDASAYAEALAIGLAAGDEDDGELVLTTDEADCVAPELVDIVGVDTFTGAGVAPEELEDPGYQFSALGLDTDTGGDLIDAFGGCDVDVVGALFETLTADLDEEQTACLMDELDEGMARQFLIEALVQVDLSKELSDELARIDSVCKLS